MTSTTVITFYIASMATPDNMKMSLIGMTWYYYILYIIYLIEHEINYMLISSDIIWYHDIMWYFTT